MNTIEGHITMTTIGELMIEVTKLKDDLMFCFSEIDRLNARIDSFEPPSRTKKKMSKSIDTDSQSNNFSIDIEV